MAIEGINNVQSSSFQPSNYQPAQASRPIENISISEDDKAKSVAVADANANKDQDDQIRDVSNEQIKKAVSDINKKMSNTSCQFGIHEGTGHVTIKIVDKSTKEILKEFPAKETLEMIEKAWELAGIMVDEKL